eukprot:CAMPEP_0182566204 /NCGR_PEP_ID=MMETSP1324-20130603/7737_1 /TAXON_ID=236786 /ORGANISM="Florenciella sp., Strain RCC1587" /LENGTH=368 /DNA_ID=CAMNT_0024779967 /DNA_START=63 /DNA_END=1170 /DNA_ORIENTATION=+
MTAEAHRPSSSTKKGSPLPPPPRPNPAARARLHDRAAVWSADRLRLSRPEARFLPGLLDGRRRELRQHERRLVNLRVVVPKRRLHRSFGLALGQPHHVVLAVGRAEDEAYLARRVGGYSGVRVLDGGKDVAARGEDRGDEVEVQPHALALRADHAARVERRSHLLVELGLEQRLRRAHRVARVDDDHVVHVVVLLRNVGRGVLEEEVEPRVVERRRHRLGEVLLGALDHQLVDLAHVDLLHAVMPHDLAQHAAVAAADDEDGTRPGAGEHGQVGDHLLVRKLVALRELDHAVQHQHFPVVRRLEDENVLELGLALEEDALGLTWSENFCPGHITSDSLNQPFSTFSAGAGAAASVDDNHDVIRVCEVQ